MSETQSAAGGGRASRIAEIIRARRFDSWTVDLADEIAVEILAALAAAPPAPAASECAKVADRVADAPPSNDARHIDWQAGWQDGAMQVAAEIRALAAAPPAPAASAPITAAGAQRRSDLSPLLQQMWKALGCDAPHEDLRILWEKILPYFDAGAQREAVIEECAKAAEGRSRYSWSQGGSYDAGRLDASAAVRALAQTDSEASHDR